MHSPLAFDRDPLFGHLENPLTTLETRLKEKRQRFWIWKEPDFFWFWNEDEPDFYGVFFEGIDKRYSLDQRPILDERWFDKAAHTTDQKNLRAILHHQLHHGPWARAITLHDPRSDKNGLWRVLWRGRNFLLQNALNGRAVRFFPESDWEKGSPHWRQLHYFAHDATFFANLFWPLFKSRRGRLKTAFEFLDLPIEKQKQPLEFERGNYAQFVDVMRSALIAGYQWNDNTDRILYIRFHPNTREILFDTLLWELSRFPFNHQKLTNEQVHQAVRRVGRTFSPHLTQGATFQSVARCPLMMFSLNNDYLLYVQVRGLLSAHQQVEAVVTVRNWLTEYAPELLPEWS